MKIIVSIFAIVLFVTGLVLLQPTGGLLSGLCFGGTAILCFLTAYLSYAEKKANTKK